MSTIGSSTRRVAAIKYLFLLAIGFSAAISISCDVRSETAKKEMEKFSGTPRSSGTPAPTPEPVDPADTVQVDTSVTGDLQSFNGYTEKRSLNCAKYNNARVNGDSNVVKITGTCKQIMINGDNNEVTLDAATEAIFNGTGNTLKYARYVNGKRPNIVENQSGNNIEKIPFQAGKSGR